MPSERFRKAPSVLPGPSRYARPVKIPLTWPLYALVALHPAGIVANVLDAEPFELAAVVAVEGLFYAIPLAWLLPAAESKKQPAPADPELAIDGFRVSWPAFPGLTSEEAMVNSFGVGLIAAAGGVFWLGFSLPLNRGVDGTEGLVVWMVAAMFAALVGVTQAVVTSVPRWLFNQFRQRDIQLELQGRDLEVDGERWRLHHTDVYDRTPTGVRLTNGDRSLDIRANGSEAAWLLDALGQARPDDDDGTVPASLRTLRDAR